MDNVESTLETKLKQLERDENKTDEVLKGGKRLSNLKELITEVDNTQRALKALKIEAKISDEDISDWNNVIGLKIEEADGHIENVEEWLARGKLEGKRRENALHNKTPCDKAKITREPPTQGWDSNVVRGNLCQCIAAFSKLAGCQLNEPPPLEV